MYHFIIYVYQLTAILPFCKAAIQFVDAGLTASAAKLMSIYLHANYYVSFPFQ